MRIFCPAITVLCFLARVGRPPGYSPCSPATLAHSYVCVVSRLLPVRRPAPLRPPRSGVSEPQATLRPPRSDWRRRAHPLGAQPLYYAAALAALHTRGSVDPRVPGSPSWGGAGDARTDPQRYAGGIAPRVSLDDLRNPTGADGTPAFATREAPTLLHGDRLDQLHGHGGVVTRHRHLGALGEGHHPGDVGGPEVELRTVVLEERRVPPTLVLGEDVHRRLELGVRGGGARLDHDHAALHVLPLDTAQQQTAVLARPRVVQHLAEHLDAGDGGLDRLLLDADDLDLLHRLEQAALDPAGHHGAPPGDGEDVLDRHQERLVDVPLGLRDRRVAGGHQLHHLVGRGLVALQRLERGDPHHRHAVTGELVRAEQDRKSTRLNSSHVKNSYAV